MTTYTRIPPYSGTLRLYVDGGAGGDDAHDGTSWAQAWKTAAKVEQTVSDILSSGPIALQLMIYFRGAFSNETLRLCGSLPGGTNVHLIHHVDDWTEIDGGVGCTVASVAAASALAGTGQAMRQITVNGFALTTAMNGAWIVLTDGAGKRLTYQILRVFNNGGTPTATISTTSAPPVWVTGATISVRQPSVSGLTLVEYALQYGQTWDQAVLQNHNVVLGLACGSFNAVSTQGLSFVVKATTATAYVCSIFMVQCAYCESQFSTAFVPAAQAAEWGIIGTNTTETCQFGCWTTGAAAGSGPYIRGSADCVVSGYITQDVAFVANSHGVVRRANCTMTSGQNGAYSHANVIVRGGSAFGVEAGHGSFVLLTTVSFIDLPAAGLSSGLAHVNKGGWMQIASTVDGINTGTGAGLYAIRAEKGSKLQCENGPADGFSGDDGRLYAVDAEVSFAAALSFAASAGGGPDIFLQHCRAYFADNVTKSAVNSETAIQTGVDGEIIAIGTRFKTVGGAFTTAHIGRSIKISGAVNPANNDVHLITGCPSGTEVTLGSAVGLVNEGPGLTWGLVGTPQPIIEVARGGKVTQAAGKSFSIKNPEVNPVTTFQDWDGYGYGPNGAIYIHENAEATLGTLVNPGGAANAINLAATVRNRSSLLHTGGAIPQGVTPLKLGGNAAAAWPATAVNDSAAGTPEQCIIIPNV